MSLRSKGNYHNLLFYSGHYTIPYIWYKIQGGWKRLGSRKNIMNLPENPKQEKRKPDRLVFCITMGSQCLISTPHLQSASGLQDATPNISRVHAFQR